MSTHALDHARLRATIQAPASGNSGGTALGDWSLPMQKDSTLGPNPSGLCTCGCGEAAPIATMTSRRKGHVKGQPMKFVAGHQSRGVKRTAEFRARISDRMSGSGNPSWRGGKADLRGYVRVRVGKGHPMAAVDGYALEHRLVASKMLGRSLRSDEIVHHIDLNRSNNTPENLVVLDQSTHRSIHALTDAGMDPHEAMKQVLA